MRTHGWLLLAPLTGSTAPRHLTAGRHAVVSHARHCAGRSHTGGKKLQQVTEAKTGRMEVRNNKVPGQGWKIDPLPKGAFRSSVRRVAMISEACLPKIDGVSKTTYLVAQHHLNQGREVGCGAWRTTRPLPQR